MFNCNMLYGYHYFLSIHSSRSVSQTFKFYENVRYSMVFLLTKPNMLDIVSVGIFDRRRSMQFRIISFWPFIILTFKIFAIHRIRQWLKRFHMNYFNVFSRNWIDLNTKRIIYSHFGMLRNVRNEVHNFIVGLCIGFIAAALNIFYCNDFLFPIEQVFVGLLRLLLWYVFLSAEAGNGLQLPRATVLIRIYLFSNKIFCFLCALIQAEMLHIRYTHCQSISSHIFLSLLPIYGGFLLLLLSTLWLTHRSTNS